MLSLNYEYRVIPAPRRAMKAKAISNSDDRFALSLSILMNDQGREGWEYVRTDTLPMDERSGLTGTKTSYMNMLVFRRVILRQTHVVDAENEDFDLGSSFLPPKMLRPASAPGSASAADPFPEAEALDVVDAAIRDAKRLHPVPSSLAAE